MSAYIPLSHGKFAIIDEADVVALIKYKWYASHEHGPWYAKRNIPMVNNNRKPMIAMHRQIMNALKGTMIDHINRNGLDNRKSNLRFCTKAQNCCNRIANIHKKSSQYKGVFFDKRPSQRGRPWFAAIKKNHKIKYLGTFVSEIEAAEAYDRTAKELFGQFARFNLSSP